MSVGQVVQCIGAVVDIQFPRNDMPRVYDALLLEDSGEKSFAEKGLTFEVEQQLGDGVVRCIAMGSSDGLRRGMKVSSTGAPISVPVGNGTLGRIMDVLGRPIDERGPILSDERRAIHQAAPKFDELSPSLELLETGVLNVHEFFRHKMAAGALYRAHLAYEIRQRLPLLDLERKVLRGEDLPVTADQAARAADKLMQGQKTHEQSILLGALGGAIGQVFSNALSAERPALIEGEVIATEDAVIEA